jgi:glucose dehydrogenase
LYLLLATGLSAGVVVSLASAGSTARSVSPSQETAWPWEPQGSIPAGTSGNDWQYPKGDLAGSDFSYLNQINTSNVANLKLAWQQSFSSPSYMGTVQGAPIVVSGAGKNLPLESGTMFIVADAGVFAVDPTTGKILWQYVGPPPKPNSPGGTPAPQLIFGNTTKSMSFCNGTVLSGQQDGSIVALNAKTGAPLWTNQVSDVNEFAGHTGQTSPPTDCDPTAGPNHDGLVFAGPNGSSSPLRGHLDAIDVKTGQLVWRWFTTPDPTQLPFILTWGNPAEAALGGGGTWGSSAIDPGLGEVFSETGNAYAQLGRQPGKDLWTTSSFALDENTGQLRWYWQETHHDNWDYDHGSPPTLMNVTINGKVYPAFVSCNKAAWCEVLDRRNGSPLPGFPMKEVPVSDPSGKGLALNNEWPTQPESACQPTCAMANLSLHAATAATAQQSFPTYPVGPDGNQMTPEPIYSASYSNFWTLYPCNGLTCINYDRHSYDPMTNNFYVCADNQLLADENNSPTDWHINRISGPVISVWVSAVNMSKNTMSWQDQLNGATYVNGNLTGGQNPGFAQGTWSGGCYGGIITTAGNLLFMDSRGDTSQGSTIALTNDNYGGTLAAFNATNGKLLWTWQAPDQINAPPITYEVNGKQYVAVYNMSPVQGSPVFTGHHDQLSVFTLP